jgi:alpha-beta hydrolase superfamily lysophospholipase
LVLHGEKDRITSAADSKFFIDNIKHKVKEHYLIKDGLHEMYLDFEKEEFRNKVLSWINKTKNFGKTDKRKLMILKIK